MPNFTNNAYLDALLEGYRLGNTTLNYYLKDVGGNNFTAVERAAFAQATALWNEVANINFAETLVEASAHFIETLFVNGADNASGNLGTHSSFIGSSTNTVSTITIGQGGAGALSGQYNRSGFGWDENDANGGLLRGGIGFSTIIHELGHGLGLEHTHTTGSGDQQFFPGAPNAQDPGDNGLNDSVFSVMSYRDGPAIRPNFIGEVQNWGKVGGPMAFDIAAAQFLYGANMTTRTGNDVYTLPDAAAVGTYWSAIWDAGGNDTISYQGTLSAVIDLRAATLQNEVGGGGFMSRAGNTFGGFTIANGVVIENATGGSGNDTLIGNAADNTLNGGAGADQMTGGLGNDFYTTDNPGDVIVELDGQGFDVQYIAANGLTMGDYVEQAVMLEGIGIFSLAGSNISNLITGNANDNYITVGGGSNLVYAGGGSDQIVGGSLADLLDGRGDNDGIAGMAGSDILFGGTGNDTLDGGADNDAMYGDFGDDTYYRDSVGDQIFEAAGAGFDTVYSAISYALEINVEIAILQASAVNGSLSGNGGHNGLSGNESGNVLFGAAGSDILYGNGGDDTLNGGADADALYGGNGSDRFVLTNDNLFGPMDTVGDLEANGTDRIALQGDFAALGPTVDASELRYGAVALDANDFLLFDTATGILRYDADGSGSFASVELATLNVASGVLDATDFEIL